MANTQPQSHSEQQNSEALETKLLLEAIYLKYGFDFRDYAITSIKRRIKRRLSLAGIPDIGALQHRVIHDADFFEVLLADFSVNVSEMFRDPSFYRALRASVLPMLRDLEFIKIWHAGCSTGEEVYSMAILLTEEGLYDRCRIYATDFNEKVLSAAKSAIFPIKTLQQGMQNYRLAGGKDSFANYYTAAYDHVKMKQTLARNIVFSCHNLATDRVFGEMDVVVCRNVLIYFNRALQDKTITLFHKSLTDGGFLCLGNRESVRFTGKTAFFGDFSTAERIYRKMASHAEHK